MRIFGLEISRARSKAQALSSVDSSRGWFNIIREAWGGAWQSDITVDAPRDVLAFSAVYGCVTIIASDIGKLRPRVVEEREDGTCVEMKAASPHAAVLAKPNRFQNRVKFFEQWIVSKLLYGNTYALKQRDKRGIVVGLYLLHPERVTPLIAESGDVYYRIAADHLAGLGDGVTVPASEVIHDVGVALWHPLVGVSPIYACGLSATMANRIQKNSTTFFGNLSRPSGILTSPNEIKDETAERLKKAFEDNFSGQNVGRIAVAGDGLKYEAMTIPASDAQLIEQLKWTVEDAARCFHVPLYKLGGQVPAGSTVEQLQQGYYSECLQALIESVEICLDEGLALPAGRYAEFDLDGLMRMDTAAKIAAEAEAVKGAIKSPNEARLRLNLPPVSGGDSPYLQQQNYSLEALAKRDAQEDPFKAGKGGASEPPQPAPSGERDEEAREGMRAMLAELAMIIDRAKEAPQPQPGPEDGEEAAAAAVAEAFVRGLMQPGPSHDGLPASAALHAAARIQEEEERRAAEDIARFDQIEASQERIAAQVEAAIAASKRVEEALYQPVEPVHDPKTGRLKHAQRKRKGNDQ